MKTMTWSRLLCKRVKPVMARRHTAVWQPKAFSKLRRVRGGERDQHDAASERDSNDFSGGRYDNKGTIAVVSGYRQGKVQGIDGER